MKFVIVTDGSDYRIEEREEGQFETHEKAVEALIEILKEEKREANHRSKELEEKIELLSAVTMDGWIVNLTETYVSDEVQNILFEYPSGITIEEVRIKRIMVPTTPFHAVNRTMVAHLDQPDYFRYEMGKVFTEKEKLVEYIDEIRKDCHTHLEHLTDFAKSLERLSDDYL